MPVTQQDLYNAFGSDNVRLWSDLNGNNDDDEIAGRVAWAITKATNLMRGYLQPTNYVVDDALEDELIKDNIVSLAAIRLYGKRAVTDSNGVNIDPLSTARSDFKTFMNHLKLGQLSLSTAVRDPITYPTIVTNAKNSWFD